MNPLALAARKWRGLRHVLKDRRLQRTPVAQLPPVELAVCAIFKDEARIMAEWIEFHLLQGVERFYLYNNNSSDNSMEVLKPYIAEGLVTVHAWPLHPAQINAYNHCLKWRKNEAKWMLIIDLDEFVYTTGDKNLLETLDAVKPAPALAINWIRFSTSGHIRRPKSGLVMENYTRCGIEGDPHVKVAVQPALTERMYYAHQGIYHDSKLAVNEKGVAVTGPFSPPSIETIRINHYHTKSVEDFMVSRRKRGQADTLERCEIENLLDTETNHNDGEDLQIQKWIEPVKQALQSRSKKWKVGI